MWSAPSAANEPSAASTTRLSAPGIAPRDDVIAPLIFPITGMAPVPGKLPSDFAASAVLSDPDDDDALALATGKGGFARDVVDAVGVASLPPTAFCAAPIP